MVGASVCLSAFLCTTWRVISIARAPQKSRGESMTAFMASGGAASVASVASSDDGSDYSSGLPAAERPRKDSSVRVAVRIRPMLPKEIAMNTTVCVEPQDGHVVQLTTSQKRFTYVHASTSARTKGVTKLEL